jgi:hypothetical protein
MWNSHPFFLFNLATASELQSELFVVDSYCAELWIDDVDFGTCIRNWFLNRVQIVVAVLTVISMNFH